MEDKWKYSGNIQNLNQSMRKKSVGMYFMISCLFDKTNVSLKCFENIVWNSKIEKCYIFKDRTQILTWQWWWYWWWWVRRCHHNGETVASPHCYPALDWVFARNLNRLDILDLTKSQLSQVWINDPWEMFYLLLSPFFS